MKIGAIWALLMLCVIMTSVITSCKSTLPISKVDPATPQQMLDSMADKLISYDFFYAKARIKYNGEESKLGGRSTIMMVPDSLIWMNMKKLSIEGVRSLVTPDSCWILYRQDNLVESGSTRDFLDYYNIYFPFVEVQDILVGNLFIPSLAELIQVRSDDYHYLSFDRNNDRYTYLLYNDFSIYKILIRDIFDRKITLTFSDYDEHHFARRKEIEVILPEQSVSRLSLKFTNVTFNEPKTIKFEVPSHYTHIN